ncbi:MAG: YggS family pyridoxal phosphate-dependent enzyme [Aggregatilineales bacterium]
MSIITDNIETLRRNIAAACQTAGRSPDEITIVAISKRHPEQAILEAMQTGLMHFGENRVAETQDKVSSIAAQVETLPNWHMVGHIQSRKAKHIPGLFDTVHSVDSVKLAKKLAQSSANANVILNIFLEINISGEASKSGFDAYQWTQHKTKRDTLWQQIREIIALPALNVQGFMTMAPHGDNPEATRPIFRDLAMLRDTVQDDLSVTLPDLSMGMSNDYMVAIEEGATLIRPGTAIFGTRQY